MNIEKAAPDGAAFAVHFLCSVEMSMQLHHAGNPELAWLQSFPPVKSPASVHGLVLSTLVFGLVLRYI